MESMAVDSESEPELDLDLEKLESDVTQMAKKIFEYRQTLPDHLRDTLDSVLSSHRPDFPNTHSGSNPIAETQVYDALGTEEQESEEKMIQLKERMSKNVAAIPRVAKRMRECMESIDKLDSLDGTIHPDFRRRRIN